MSRKPRSLKQQMDLCTSQMRERGMTWRDIARAYQSRYRLPPLRAFREAHRYTQAKVVEIWNTLWPDDALSERRLGAWEAWPGPTGHEPSVTNLNRLARIYQCRAGDLVNGEDHTDADDHATAQKPEHAIDLRGDGTAADSHSERLTVGEIQMYLAGLPTFAAGEPLPTAARLRDHEFSRLVLALTEWADHMRRRDLLALIASAAAAAHASPMLNHLDEDALERLALAAANPSRVDATAIEHIAGILHHSTRQEDVLGPQAVLAQHGLVRRLLSGASSDDLHRRLLSLLADVSRFTGWLLFNQGDYPGAEHYYAQARRAAHEADDDALSSYVLAQWSHLATWCGDPRLGVEHALGSLAWAQRAGSRMLIAYAHDVGARAYAAVLRRERRGQAGRDHARVRTALGAARSNLDEAQDDDPGHDLVYFYGHGLHLSTRAECFLALREPDQTILHTREAMIGIGDALARLDLCQAYAQKRKVDRACTELGRAAQLAHGHHSRRLVIALQDRRRELSPWQRTDAVVRLDEQLHAYGLLTHASTIPLARSGADDGAERAPAVAAGGQFERRHRSRRARCC